MVETSFCETSSPGTAHPEPVVFSEIIRGGQICDELRPHMNGQVKEATGRYGPRHIWMALQMKHMMKLIQGRLFDAE